jgi:DNA-binding IclR family transcriptional regulator
MLPKKKEHKRHVEAVVKALEVLDCFEGRKSLRVTDITDLTGLNNSRAIRLCGTLRAMNYLVYDEEDKSYRLGPRLMVLGKAYEQFNDLISLVKPLLRKLSVQTGETALLFVADGLSRLCIAKEIGPHPIHFSIEEGERRDLYLGASGRILITFGPESVRKRILALLESNPNKAAKVGGLNNFRQSLDNIAKDGFAVSSGEVVADASALSVPVFNMDKAVRASISIALPTYRLEVNKSKILKALLHSASKLSMALGGG